MTNVTRTVPVTVIVPVRNEEKNIADCLESLDWAEKVYVVDSGSRDKTVALAERYGAEVVQFKYDGGWPKKKNWAIRNLPIPSAWIFIVDADERVSEELRIEIERAVQDPEIAGYYVRWKFMFLGHWMKHSWSHGWMLRLFRKGAGEYENLGMKDEGGWDNEVHENIVVEGQTAKLENYLLHESNQSLSYWLAKQNQFSDWNAIRREKQIGEPLPAIGSLLSGDPLKRRKFLKRVFLMLPLKPLWLFLYLYFAKLGFLDGHAGAYFCALRAAHELNVNAKLYELRCGR